MHLLVDLLGAGLGARTARGRGHSGSGRGRIADAGHCCAASTARCGLNVGHSCATAASRQVAADAADGAIDCGAGRRGGAGSYAAHTHINQHVESICRLKQMGAE